jgi:uncharacterized protein (DUF58 family)
METKELLKKVRKIEIKTKGLTNNIFAGEYHSAFKGRGMAFSEVREYQYGDDIRNIDWNVTARFGHPYIKVFEEERELTVILMIDVSSSIKTGSKKLKSNLIAELAAVISFSAVDNNDKIGAILFDNKIQKFIPPQKGRSHILRIIREIISFAHEDKNGNNNIFKDLFSRPKIKSDFQETDISEALRFLTNAIKKKSTVFLISDFDAPDFSKALRIANHKHDVIALFAYDEIEMNLPAGYNLRLQDSEKKSISDINAKNKEERKIQNNWWSDKHANLKDTFAKAGVDYTLLATDKDYVKPLMNLFKKR